MQTDSPPTNPQLGSPSKDYAKPSQERETKATKSGEKLEEAKRDDLSNSNPLLLNELLWNKPSLILEQKSDMVAMYNNLLALVTSEKSAKERYCKDIGGNIAKIQELLAGIKKDRKKTTFIMFADLLKVYSGVLLEVQEECLQDIKLLDDKLVKPLSSVLKESKAATDRLQESVDLIHRYQKQLKNVEGLRRTTHDSYLAYEQGVHIEDLVSKITQDYVDEFMTPPPRNKAESLKNSYYNKELDYSNAVVHFNKDAPKLLSDSVGLSQR